MTVVLIWSALTLTFIWRLRVIMQNLGRHLVQPGIGFLRLPAFNPRPIKQLVIWCLELWLLLFFYSAFGTAVVSHITASVCGFGLMLMLRERHVPILEGIQLIPIAKEEYCEQQRRTAA